MSVRVNERSDYFKLINWHHVAGKRGMAGCAKQHHQQYQSIQHFEKNGCLCFYCLYRQELENNLHYSHNCLCRGIHLFSQKIM